MIGTGNRWNVSCAALLLALCVAVFAAPASAQMGYGMMGGGSGYGPGPGRNAAPDGGQGWAEPYTREQQAAYWEVVRSYAPKQSALWAELAPLQAGINAALAAEKPDAAAVRKQAGRIGELMGELFKLRVEFSLALRDKGLPVYTLMGPGMMGFGMMGPGMGMGYGMGGGMGYGGMMGYGQGPGGGYGMGPGAMGGWR